MNKTNLNAAFEPFEPRYLEVLAEEGIDLRAFLESWCRAMRDDLDRLDQLRRERESAHHVPALLHRVSGAVGLVGAQHLMDALRRASTSLSEHNAGSIDALMARTSILIAQLEAAPYIYRSARP
ncbi:hypothetical protein [Paraburkholderia dilworthii]|uniref:hypothetical protein n=1 Tax=Paraburkholderia dilworthii TaxID=948106 RepID=UPI000487DC4D|nr:hypothetical protein [Paraburkholderia dilworthii]